MPWLKRSLTTSSTPRRRKLCGNKWKTSRSFPPRLYSSRAFIRLYQYNTWNSSRYGWPKNYRTHSLGTIAELLGYLYTLFQTGDLYILCKLHYPAGKTALWHCTLGGKFSPCDPISCWSGRCTLSSERTVSISIYACTLVGRA